MKSIKDTFINSLKQSVKMLAAVAFICLIYKLKIVPALTCLSFALLVNMMIIKEKKKEKYYLKRFNDVVLYMEQMIYSFKKQPKIRPALTDAQKVSTDAMREIIEEAILNIDSKISDDIYEDSLRIIDEEYGCRRLKSLHAFLIKIEKHGGDYENYINILLEDIKEWNDRTAMFINDVKRIKRNVLLSVLSTIVTCGFMAYLIPGRYSYTDNIIYQICSMVVIVLMLLVYWYVCKKLNIDWLKEKTNMSDSLIARYYVLSEKAYTDISDLTMIEKISYRKAKRRLENEISKAFPDWLREVSINLQNETVQSAIESSYSGSVFVLKRPIRKLLIDFENYPVGIEPYDNFLKEYDLTDIKSSIKMFYSINELGKEQSQQQINSIIDRNNKMAGQAEKMKNRDKIGAASMLTVIPMVLGVVKIMVDMVLMIMMFTSSLSG